MVKISRDSLIVLMVSLALLLLGAWFVIRQGRAEGQAVAAAMASLRLMVYVAGAVVFVTGAWLSRWFANAARRTDQEARYPPAGLEALDWLPACAGEDAHLVAARLRGAAMGLAVFSVGAVVTGLFVALAI